MARTDLQRLFWRAPTTLITPLEDFTSEALAIAIRYDPRPLLQVFANTEWKSSSGSPLLNLATVVRVTTDTQVYLPVLTKDDSGRLDVVADLEDAAGVRQSVWIEVKINAPVSGKQCKVYLAHREARPAPRPFIVTLTKTRKPCEDITGISWQDIISAVDASANIAPPLDRSWAELVAFLRTEVVLPALGGPDPKAFLPVFSATSETIESLWLDPPRPLTRSPGDLKRALGVRMKFYNDMLLTGGPLVWGLRATGPEWEWWVAIGTGTNWTRVWVSEAAVHEAAKGRLLEWTATTERYHDRYLVFEKRRLHEGGESVDEAARWLCEAMRELHDAEVLEPYHAALRKTLDGRGEGIDPKDGGPAPD